MATTVMSRDLRGWLRKKHNKKGEHWADRYFVADDTRGLLMMSKGDRGKKNKASVILPLQDIASVKPLEGNECSFVISCPPVHLTVRAEDLLEVDKWAVQLMLRARLWQAHDQQLMKVAVVSDGQSSLSAQPSVALACAPSKSASSGCAPSIVDENTSTQRDGTRRACEARASVAGEDATKAEIEAAAKAEAAFRAEVAARAEVTARFEAAARAEEAARAEATAALQAVAQFEAANQAEADAEGSAPKGQSLPPHTAATAATAGAQERRVAAPVPQCAASAVAADVSSTAALQRQERDLPKASPTPALLGTEPSTVEVMSDEDSDDEDESPSCSRVSKQGSPDVHERANAALSSDFQRRDLAAMLSSDEDTDDDIGPRQHVTRHRRSPAADSASTKSATSTNAQPPSDPTAGLPRAAVASADPTAGLPRAAAASAQPASDPTAGLPRAAVAEICPEHHTPAPKLPATSVSAPEPSAVAKPQECKADKGYESWDEEEGDSGKVAEGGVTLVGDGIVADEGFVDDDWDEGEE